MSKTYLVPAIKRAFEVLNLIGETENGYTLSHIHRTLKLPLSSAATIMYTLESLGYVRRNERNSSYVLGTKLRTLTRHLERVDLVERCHGLLSELVGQTGLTGHLAVTKDSDAIYVDRVQSENLVQINSYIGMAWPLYSCGVGKAMLAYLAPEALEARLDTIAIKKSTPKTVGSRKHLEKQLANFRHLGYAYEMDENVIGVGCVAAAIIGPQREVLGGISLAGTTQQITPHSVVDLGRLVRKCAAEMSLRVGGEF